MSTKNAIAMVPKTELTRGQKAARTRKRNYAKNASPEHLQELRNALPDVPEEELMEDLSFHEHLVGYKEMIARKTSEKGKREARLQTATELLDMSLFDVMGMWLPSELKNGFNGKKHSKAADKVSFYEQLEEVVEAVNVAVSKLRRLSPALSRLAPNQLSALACLYVVMRRTEEFLRVSSNAKDADTYRLTQAEEPIEGTNSEAKVKLQAKMTDGDLDTMHKAVCEGMCTLHEQSETYGGHARILFYAAGAYLRERGILEGLDAAGAYLEENGQRVRNKHAHDSGIPDTI